LVNPQYEHGLPPVSEEDPKEGEEDPNLTQLVNEQLEQNLQVDPKEGEEGEEQNIEEEGDSEQKVVSNLQKDPEEEEA
jgi:hypothetical protein